MLLGAVSVHASKSPRAPLSYKQVLHVVSQTEKVQELIIAYLRTELNWNLYAQYGIQAYSGSRLSFSPQEKYIVYANSQTKHISIWNLTSKKALPVPNSLENNEPDNIKQDETFNLMFRTDNQLLVTEANAERLTKLSIELDTQTNIGEPAIKAPEPIYTVALSQSGKFIATGSYNTAQRKTVIRLWEPNSSQCIKTFESDNKNARLQFSQRDSYLASIGSKSAPLLEIWNLQDDTVIKINELNTYGIIDLHFCKNDTHIIYGIVNVSNQRDCLKKWDLRAHKQVWHIYLPKPAHKKHQNLASLAISPDEKFYALNFYSPGTGLHAAESVIRIFDELFSDCQDFALDSYAKLLFSPANNFLVAASYACQKLYIWKNQKAEQITQPTNNAKLVKKQSTLGLLHNLLPVQKSNT